VLLKTAAWKKTECSKNTHARMSYNVDLPCRVCVDEAMFNILDTEQCVWSVGTVKETKRRQQ